MSSASYLCGVMGCVVWDFCSYHPGCTYFRVLAAKKILFEGVSMPRLLLY